MVTRRQRMAPIVPSGAECGVFASMSGVWGSPPDESEPAKDRFER